MKASYKYATHAFIFVLPRGAISEYQHQRNNSVRVSVHQNCFRNILQLLTY